MSLLQMIVHNKLSVPTMNQKTDNGQGSVNLFF